MKGLFSFQNLFGISGFFSITLEVYLTNKIYTEWKKYRSQVVKLAPLTELGYLNLRSKYNDIYE